MSVYGNNAPVLVSAYDDLYTPRIITTGRRPSDSFIRAVGGHMVHPRERVRDTIPLSIRNKEEKLVRVGEKEAVERKRVRIRKLNEWKTYERAKPTKALSPGVIARLEPRTKRWYRQKLYERKMYFNSRINEPNLKRAYEVAYGISP